MHMLGEKIGIMDKKIATVKIGSDYARYRS